MRMMAFVLLVASALATTDRPELAKLQIDGGRVWGEGVWRPDYPNRSNEGIETVTHYYCSITGGMELVGTEAWCLEASASSPYGMLDVGVEWLKVVSWDDKQITAVNDSTICLSQQVIFDVKRKTAIALDVRKPEAKGVFEVCKKVPDRQTYYLQDKANYYIRKATEKLP
jgi:hypothetical protein